MCKQNIGNVSVRFTNYIKQGGSGNQSLLDGELEEVSMALISSFNLDDMKQLLDKEFEKPMQAHNCDYTIVMPLYRKMYNLYAIEDILKGKRDPSEIFTKDENTIFMEAESSVTGGTKQINW